MSRMPLDADVRPNERAAESPPPPNPVSSSGSAEADRDCRTAVQRLTHAIAGRRRQIAFATRLRGDLTSRDAARDQRFADDAGAAFREALVVRRRAGRVGVADKQD